MINKKIGKKKHIIGKGIYLRPLRKIDINKRYLSWLNDTLVTKYMETKFNPPTLKDLDNYYEELKNSKSNEMFAIVTSAKNEHIGNIKLGNINPNHRYADLGIMIGERKYWGKGYGQEACRLLLGYAFKRLNLNKVILGVYENHAAAIRTYQNLGFKIEGRIKDLLNFEGKYADKIIMGISQQKFLKHKGR